MTARRSSTSTEPVAVVEALFAEMLLLFGRKFLDQWRGADASALKTYWAQHLALMTGDELARGKSALQALDWPPTLPEFVKLCRPPIAPVAAYHQALSAMACRDRGETGHWPHPAVYWAAVAVGAHDLRSQPYHLLQFRWEAALTEEFAKGHWPPVPAPAVALPPPRGRRPMPPSVLDAARAATSSPGGDPRGWARRLLARRDAGLPVPPQALAMAVDALGGRAE